jgi:hypothetical protein
MMIPTIHLNGTSADELILQLQEAGSALRIAYARLTETYPDGRDYYTQGPDACSQATKEHRARLDKIAAVQDEIDQIWESVQNQVDTRSRR